MMVVNSEALTVAVICKISIAPKESAVVLWCLLVVFLEPWQEGKDVDNRIMTEFSVRSDLRPGALGALVHILE